MASVYKRGHIWWGKVQRDGKVFRRSLRTSSKQIAESRLRKWLDELEAIEWGDRPRRLFDDAAEKFILEHLPLLKPQSAYRYICSLKYLGQTFAGRYLDQVNKTTLYEFEQTRRLDGVKSPTIRRDLACLSSLFSSAIEWEWTDVNPVPAYLKSRRKRGLSEGAPRTRYLSHEEEKKLLSVADPGFSEKIALAIDTGLRREEFFSLQWHQINLPGRMIKTTADTKTGTIRTVPLLPRAVSILTGIPRNIRSPYVFCHADGNRFVHQQKKFRNTAEHAGIDDLKWHDLRRTCGCRLLQDHRLSIEEVSSWLGHASITVTERSYAFINIENVKDRLQSSADVIQLGTKTGTGSQDE